MAAPKEPIGTSNEHVARRATGGRETRLGGYAHWRGNCVPSRPPGVRLDEPPSTLTPVS